MEDEYTLVRSPVMDKTKWIEKLKYDVLRFSLDSVDINLIEIGNAISAQVKPILFIQSRIFSLSFQVAPIRLCMCNMHTSSCNESLTLKVGPIQLRQLLRLYPESWLEAGSIHIPELRINAKFDCHPPSAITINEQLEFLRRHDQYSQRLHFLYNTKTQVSSMTTLKRPSIAGLPLNQPLSSCACLGGSSAYYTLVQGEQFFKNSFRLSEQANFGRSLFRPDVHVIFSHPVFEQKYTWNDYEHPVPTNEQLMDEEILYPFDFCTRPKLSTSDEQENFTIVRSNSMKMSKSKTYRRSSSSIPINKISPENATSSSTIVSDAFLTPTEQFSLNNSKRTSLNNMIEASSIPGRLDFLSRFSEDGETRSERSSHTSSTDSLTAIEEILQRQQSGRTSTLLPSRVSSSIRRFILFFFVLICRVRQHPFLKHLYQVLRGLVYGIK